MNDIKIKEKMNDPINQFYQEKENRIDSYGSNIALKDAAAQFNVESNKAQYSYNFSWMGRPIIQYPQDMIAMQEIIWQLKPDLIIETGIAHGGSLIYYASILELIGKGEIIGIDIEIREHNRKEIENHPMYKRIKMVEGSSVSADTVNRVKKQAEGKQTVLVSLDSNHTHQHVLDELNLYSPFVTPGSYIVVFDTIVEDMPDNYLPGRAWSRGDNPKTAVWEFLKQNPDFEIDHCIDNKLLISVAPEGYLKKIR
jgi:cephalosporin hydroxylase